MIKKIGIIIQARMTSKRFPGKSVALLNHTPVIAHVIDRCMKVPFVDHVIVAVPDKENSHGIFNVIHICNRISDFKLKKGVAPKYCKDFIPSACNENDVLKRYYKCAMKYELDIIVRITGDCPFVDPRLIMKCISLLQTKNLDYTSNIHPTRTFPKGLDVECFTFDCLEAAHLTVNELCEAEMLTDVPYNREHVTSWMQNEEEVRKGLITRKKNKQFDDATDNLCVDYPEDIQRLEALIKAKLLPGRKKSSIIRLTDDNK